MGTAYPTTIATDRHIAEALIATATKGVDIHGILGPDRCKVELCVRNWALRNGIKEDLAIEVARTEKRATTFINECLKHDPQIAGAWTMPWEDAAPEDHAIDLNGVAALRESAEALLCDKAQLDSRVEILERDIKRHEAAQKDCERRIGIERDLVTQLKKKTADLEKQLTELRNEREFMRKGYVPASLLSAYVGDVDNEAAAVCLNMKPDSANFIYLPKLIAALRDHWFAAGAKFARSKKKAA